MSQEPAAVAARARARLGSTLNGKYTLDRLLGSGGMADVYAATHRNARRVAVKLLHPELSLHADLRARFLREGYLANSVGHAGAVAALDDEVAEDGSAFLVMELLEGEALDQLQRRLGPRLSARVVLGVAWAALDVLDAAHERSIVHRDIKPSNLFLTPSGHLKVLDFGIARMSDGSSVLTSTGLALGTPWFMAPEQAMGQASLVGRRTDVWSVGATMYELLTGQHVHDQAASAQEAMIWAATKPAPPLSSVRDDLPIQVTALVDRALAFAADGRWPTAKAMRDAVAEAFFETEKERLTEAAIQAVAVAVPTTPVPPSNAIPRPRASSPQAPTLAARRSTPRPSAAEAKASSVPSGVAPRHLQVILSEDVFAVVDDGGAQAREYIAVRELIMEHVKKCPGGVGCLAIIPRTAKPPPEETRQALNALLQDLAGSLRCICWLVEGTGFQGAMVRGVLTGLTLVARRSYATHVSANLEEAIVWMLGYLQNPQRRANAVERVMGEIQKQRMDREVAVAR